jgi:hypothetical protein
VVQNIKSLATGVIMGLAVTIWQKNQCEKLLKQLSSEEITRDEFDQAMQVIADEYEAMKEEYNGGRERF